MARGSTGSRSTGRTPISGPIGQTSPINFGANAETGESSAGIGFGTNEEGDREITGEGSIGGAVGGGGRNNSINPAGASPFSPSTPKPPRTSDLIDLTKDAVSDLGKKPPIRGGGGIGVEAGASAAGNLGITATIPIGLSPFQARGGVIFDPETGEISGGSLGGGIGFGPISATADAGVDEGGCIQFITIGIGPFTRTFQRNVCSPNPPPTPTPSPSPTPTPGGEGIEPAGETIIESGLFGSFRLYGSFSAQYVYSCQASASNSTKTDRFLFGGASSSPGNPVSLKRVAGPSFTGKCGQTQGITYFLYVGNTFAVGSYAATNKPHTSSNFPTTWIHNQSCWLERVDGTPLRPETSTPAPLPNTPPRKNKMADACCKYLASLIIAHSQNLSNLLGQPINELAEPIEKPVFPVEVERTETPREPDNPNKLEKVTFNNFKELLFYILEQSINLDVALDPKAYLSAPVEDGKKFMNPEYERPTDTTLKENKEPDKDKKGNKRELEAGKDLRFTSALAEQRYILNAINRFEYLFPMGELADAQISKDLLIPGQQGELKIFNLIHAYEILMQYLSATLGDPREKIILKDVNPAKPGDQGVKFGHQSISHLIREMYKFSLDTAGDVDALMMMGLRDFRTNLANRIQIVQIAEIVEALFEDTGMLEKQEYIKLALEGDPYAGQYVEGKGFEPRPELDEDTEEATEKIVEATLNNKEIKVKVSKRAPQEKADIRDLIVALAKHFERQNAIPATEQAIQDKINNAEFGVVLDMALVRQQVKSAQAVSRPRTRKKKK